jgi:hypothetical protein
MPQNPMGRTNGQTRGGTNSPANWQHQLDHYLARARAFAEAGDNVEAENCYQHADHYFRMIRGTSA